MALTLRTVCNLTTTEIAEAFLDTVPTMGQRIFRAKAKMKAKGISFSIPPQEHWPERLGTVLSTIYLIFTTGYIADDIDTRFLCQEALFLARLLNELRPEDPEIEGALALMLLCDARRSARIAKDGASVPVTEQDRTLWKQTLITEGQGILARAVSRKQSGPFQIKAAITDCHMMHPEADWLQMSLLYQSLWYYEPTPVVALNWAVVLAELDHAELALQKCDELYGELSEYQPWYAARADILSKLDRPAEAIAAYNIAIEKAQNSSHRIFLERRREQLCFVL